MQKPLTVMQQETVQKVVDIVNDSGLPAFILVSIFESVTEELRQLAERQYKSDLEQYEKENKEEAE